MLKVLPLNNIAEIMKMLKKSIIKKNQEIRIISKPNSSGSNSKLIINNNKINNYFNGETQQIKTTIYKPHLIIIGEMCKIQIINKINKLLGTNHGTNQHNNLLNNFSKISQSLHQINLQIIMSNPNKTKKKILHLKELMNLKI